MSTTIERHNAPLRIMMFEQGYKWKVNEHTQHWVDSKGDYVSYPTGYITGPHYNDNGNPNPWSCSVKLEDGCWAQRAFKSALEANTWALNYLKDKE